MSIIPPSLESIKEKFPELKDLQPLKSGGFKAVYRAKIKGKDEAFKVIQLPMLESEDASVAFRKEAVGRIRREVEVLGKCPAPELVKLGAISLKYFDIERRDYVAYSEEFLEGVDLADLIRKSKDFPPEKELKTLFRCLLRAIKALWDMGYIHRDVKPLNVMKLPNSSRPFVLLDLGIAFSVRETALTYNPQERLPPATYRYMAPEMAYPDFRKNLDYRSDLYSAALTVFEYGAKVHPLARDADDFLQTISRVVREPAKPLKKFRSDLSEEFCQLIDQLLKKRPALRPSNLDRLISMMEA